MGKDEEEREVDFSKDENEVRGNWSGRLDFLLSCLGCAVGLGNVWRFPYLCYKHGGGAFLIPYVIMLVFVGMPVFFLELSLGQFSSSGLLTAFRFSKMFQGIGMGMVIVSAYVAMYYNMVIAWGIYYLFASLAKVLPWESCDNPWNNAYCFKKLPDAECITSTVVRQSNGLCYNASNAAQIVGLWNETIAKAAGIKRQLPSEQYFNNYVMGTSSGIDNIGNVKWQLLLCLILAWILVFFCLIKGIKSSGKVVYFTAVFPYVVLVILLVRGVTLDGHREGVRFYIIPKFEKLLNAKVWSDAAAQIFYSLSASFGGLIALSSYNRFHNNVLRDTLIVSLGNCLTSFFAGFVIFSFLGFQAHTMKTTVEQVAESGPGLAFIVYPDAITKMPISPLWAVLFFFMLITLGIDSQFAMLETITTSIMDRFVYLRKRKVWVIFTTCVVLFLAGLPCTTEGGIYVLNLLDGYAGGWSVLLIGLMEFIAIAWVYGSGRFCNDIRIMTGHMPSMWWQVCWRGFSPLLILFVFVFTFVDYEPLKYGDYEYPYWANVLGWVIAVTVVMFIPFRMIYEVMTTNGDCRTKLKEAASPSVYWGPALVKHRRLVDYVPNFVVDPYNTEAQTHQFTLQPQDEKKEPLDVSETSKTVLPGPGPGIEMGVNPGFYTAD